MADNNKEKMMIEGVDIGKVKNFPFSALKTLGSIQIGVGGICITLGLIDFLMLIFFEDKFISDPALKETSEYAKVDTLTKTFSPVWCGIWYCVTGAFAAVLSEKKLANINYYKMTFLILSITCAGISGPLCFIVTVTSSYLRHQLTPTGFRWLVPLLVTFFAFCEIVFAIISSAVCCCCSPFDSSRVRVLLAKQQDDDFHAIVQSEKSKDSFDIFTTADRRGNPLPPRQQEIKPEPKQQPSPVKDKKKKEEPKMAPAKKIDRLQQTTAKEEKRPHHEAPSKPFDHNRARDRKPERRHSITSDDLKSDLSGDMGVQQTRGYGDRPFTKDSSYEQLKSLALPRTAPKQTF